MLHSLVQQINYQHEQPMEGVPEEFVPLKNAFNVCLERAEQRRENIVILLGGNVKNKS